MESLPGLPKRPTITLALIAKNEEKNLPRLLDSVEGCFDEIVLVDTGSTDKTKEIAEARGCRLYDFQWIEDFSAARNVAFSKCSSDYIMWLDCDDVLENRDGFIKWRNHAMEHLEMAFATYHYALDKDFKPVVSFVRERVFKRSIEPKWQYPIHEGIIAKPEWRSSYATTWSVKHMRDDQDIAADRSRNIKIIESYVLSGQGDARMNFYYGKELYEANRASDAIPVFEKTLKMEGLQHHDRLLAIQYGGYSCLGCFDQIKDEFRDQKMKYVNKALDFAHEGIRLEPNRAEFHVLVGDSYLRIGDLPRAVPYFTAAKACFRGTSPYEGAIYSFKNLYGELPSITLARVYAHLGLLEKAKKEAQECLELYGNQDAVSIIADIDRIASITKLENNQTETDDIVFTTPPQTAYEFDEEGYKTKPYGGSETALIQMARLLREKTGRNVKVFSMRENDLLADSGVEYISNKKTAEYFSKYKPARHIAWRHNIKLTKADTFLWCHDLFTPGVESVRHFDKFLALSPFHKNYTMALQGVPEDQIIVTRNGIDPKKFDFEKPVKNPNKFVYMSSPDRGLDRAILVMDEVRKEFPEVELHVYYGIEHLHKYGPQMAELAEKLKGMMAARPWVKYHGNTEQSKMYLDVADAVALIHPANFIETFMITAIECLANGIFPITRRLGALADTLAEAEKNRQAILLPHGANNEEEIKDYAKACCRVILNRQWENLKSIDAEKFSWSSVCDEWLGFLGLSAQQRLEEVS